MFTTAVNLQRWIYALDEQVKMTSIDSEPVEMPSPVELDFEEESPDDADTRCRSPDVELPQRGGRRSSQPVEVRHDVPDDDGDGRRRVSLKLGGQTVYPSADDVDDEEIPAMELDATQPLEMEAEKPLSSGWAAALAAASAAGSVRAAAKRRTNVGRSNVFVPPPTRSLLCLSLTNPIRKLTISVVEWKYPFSQHFISRTSLIISSTRNSSGDEIANVNFLYQSY